MSAQPDLFASPSSWAVFSDCGRYRYVLGRRWGSGPRVLWVMLNPSTADAEADDPTIRRCIAFSKREGFGSLEVVNLYALRATDPADLMAADDPGGPLNHWNVLGASGRAASVVAAWGAHPMAARPNPVKQWERPVLCLGTTKAGHPRHPLYVRGDAPLVVW